MQWFIDFAGDGAKVLGFILALSTVTGAAGKFLIFDPLRREIQEATRPIQPTANGGKSLPDVVKKLDAIEIWRTDTDAKLDLVIELLRKAR